MISTKRPLKAMLRWSAILLCTQRTQLQGCLTADARCASIRCYSLTPLNESVAIPAVPISSLRFYDEKSGSKLNFGSFP